jgi:hypothetical protein
MRASVMAAAVAAALLGACLIESRTFTPLDGDAGPSGDCDAGCDVPSVPRHRFPMNDSYVGVIIAPNTLRPTFVWEPSTGQDGATITYELEYSRDRTFATGVTTVPTEETSHRPSDPLDALIIQPVGARYYWRVRACAEGRCSESSSAWWVNVGRSNRDFNGDGLADTVIGAYGHDTGGEEAGRAYAFFGDAGGTFQGVYVAGGVAADYRLGARVAFIGDVNGDGFADVGVGATHAGTFHGAAHVFLGTPSGMFGDSFDIPGESASARAAVISSAGDVNGDGYSDVIVGAPGSNTTGQARIYLGGPGPRFDVVADVTLDGEVDFDSFGQAAASAGDINGDGFADVIVGAFENDAGGQAAGRAYVYLGGAGSFDTAPDGTLTGTAVGESFGLAVAGAGDLNGDGYSDVVVGAPNSGAGGGASGVANVYFGAAGTSFDEVPEGTIVGSAGDVLGFSVASAGDVNGDDFADLVVAAPGNDDAYVFMGAAGTSFDVTPDGTLAGPTPGEFFGISVAGTGDMDGDGFDDLVIGATALSGTSAGSAFLFRGGQGPSFDETSDWYYPGEFAEDNFGCSVASL